MERKTISPDYHKRAHSAPVEASAEDVIRGEAVVFDSWSRDLGGFREIIRAGALDNADLSDVVALLDHEGQVLGRTGSGSLILERTAKGLSYEIAPPVTSLGRDVLAMVKRGDITESSFGFDIGEGNSTWGYDENGKVQHTINAIERLYDVSPVTWAAYPQTSVRSMQLFEMAQKEREGSQAKLDAIQEASEILRKAAERSRVIAIKQHYAAHF